MSESEERLDPPLDPPTDHPYLTPEGTLVVPAGCGPEWRWWTKEGKRITVILRELKAPRSVWARYVSDPYPEDLAREVYPLLG
jgi:hypothetical protein